MEKRSTQELKRKTLEEFRAAAKLPLTVVLDNVRSLHNIGSVFRTADAFLIERIFLCGISATPPHPEIHKSALGAEHSVIWKYFEDTTQALEQLRQMGYRVYAVEQTHDSILLQDFRPVPGEPTALVFGNEVLGVQQEAINLCDLYRNPTIWHQAFLQLSVSAASFFGMLQTNSLR
jgi:tRNA G18 (ribose-2'-O)-methylase SpoU